MILPSVAATPPMNSPRKSATRAFVMTRSAVIARTLRQNPIDDPRQSPTTDWLLRLWGRGPRVRAPRRPCGRLSSHTSGHSCPGVRHVDDHGGWLQTIDQRRRDHRRGSGRYEHVERLRLLPREALSGAHQGVCRSPLDGVARADRDVRAQSKQCRVNTAPMFPCPITQTPRSNTALPLPYLAQFRIAHR